MNYTTSFSAVLLLAITTQHSSAAMQWSQANIADANTIALFHFDEGGGNVAANGIDMTAGNDDFALQSTGMWQSNPGWMSSPSGHYIDNVNSVTRDINGDITSYTLHHADHMAQSNAQLPIDWNTTPGITVSFWMRDEVAVPNVNNPIYFGFGGWRDEQVEFGYRPGWSNAGRSMVNGIEADTDVSNTPDLNVWYNNIWGSILHDGNWHHIALTWDNATDQARLYIDNQLVTLGLDNANQPVTSWTADGFSGVVEEFWYLGRGQGGAGQGFGGAIDELLIQGEVLTDFSQPLNIPEPTSAVAMLALASFFMRHRRSH